MESFQSLSECASLPRNMIENSMFEEEPDVVDLAKEPTTYPLEPDDVVYEPRSSRLLVRGLGENELDEEEEDYESSARLLGMSFMNRSSSLRSNSSPYGGQVAGRACSFPSARSLLVGAFVLVVVASVAMVIYFLPKCTFTKEGCHKANQSMALIYPIASKGQLFPWTSMRLPRAVSPVHYDLTLQPNLTTMKFTGSVTITVKVNEDTKNVVLHSSGLDISKISIRPVKENQPKPAQYVEYHPWQQIAVQCPETLQKGRSYDLKLEYSANLSDSYYGFYKSSYRDKDGEQRWLAATQFEPLAARMAFPCFDEPAFKATFLIKINRDKEYISLSNMPKNKTILVSGGFYQDVFDKSVTMSTYLVAFIVADFKNISMEANGTLVSVYAVPDKLDQVNHALETAIKLLDFYNCYFQMPYPLQKLDLVAIPDFQAGAMENWGLITFRETSLMYDNTSSLLDKQLVTIVIAHELAHQWFGNLVTMEWWNDLWLNEGFATFMEYMSIERIFPDLNVGDDFLAMRFRAMGKDSLNSSHPITNQVATAEQVEEMFDSVSYEKGASILLMLKSLLTEEQFQKGVVHYLRQHKNANTQSEDLWASMSQFTKKANITELMKSWTLQKGFPLVTVTRNGTKMTLQQERFLLSVANSSSSSSSYLWQVPLTSINSSCSNASSCKSVILLKEQSATIYVPEEVQWVKFNIDMEGFYMVHYGEDGWRDLIILLKSNHSALSYQDRASLISDIFGLARLGKVSIQQVLNLTCYLVNETSTPPVTEALLQLNHIYRLLDKRGLLQLTARMKAYILELFEKLIANQSWNEEVSITQQKLRSSLLGTACSYNHEICIEKAKNIFLNWTKSPANVSIPADLMRTVFTVGIRHCDGWDSVLVAYSNSSFEAEREKMLQALASSADIRKLIWLMQTSLNGEDVRTQELPLILTTISKNFEGHLYAWGFVKENWDKIIKKFNLGSFAIHNIVMGTTSEFSTQAHLFEVKNFFGSLKDKGSQLRSVREAVETIQLNIQWMDRNVEALSHSL
ncbi:leucyl-cystinyl aminopeptidase isoform X1 [Huso huso]|uniref:Leucyl-cystinyl aminopeptidase isoform X1 n=1 Tax=Huso huso TaxID=61971 RepID=A0ABR1ACN2_HUSHU